MRAAKMKERPTFQLMCQTDVQNIYHMQMPRWLFSDPRYCEMSLDAKVAYTFLLNRFQLSRKNGWVNEHGEVFVIFPRKALAKELRICEQRVTAAFKKLVELKLVWEKRCGRGDANQIYLARVTPIEDPDYSCAPFVPEEQGDDCGSRTADFEPLGAAGVPAPVQEPQNPQSKNHENGASRDAAFAFPEPQKPTPSKKEKRDIDLSYIDVSQSVSAPTRDGRTDEEIEEELLDILDGCELYCFEPETALVFENAIERLFYADSFRIGNATLELTENAPIFYSQDRLVDPCLLRFGGDGEMLGLLFSVTWLDIPGRIAAAPRMKGERIIWITDSVDMSSIVLPKHHFFARRQEDGTHRFYGSSEPERNQEQEVN